MALHYIRDEWSSSDNRLHDFMHELYYIEYEKIIKQSKSMSKEELDSEEWTEKIWGGVPPKEQWEKIYHQLSQYHLYLEYEYGLATGGAYAIKISNQPLAPRGVFKCEYVKDFGPITTFLNAYYGLKRRRASKISIWRQYHQLAKVKHYSPAELAEKLTQLSRELIYHYRTQEYLDSQDVNIQYYEISFKQNLIQIWIGNKVGKTYVSLKAV